MQVLAFLPPLLFKSRSASPLLSPKRLPGFTNHRLPVTALAASSQNANAAGSSDDENHQQSDQQNNPAELKKKVNQNRTLDPTDLRAKVAALGLSAVLAYGLFDGITYTTFFVLAFLGYEQSTGQNPAANLKSLLGIVILMWTGNNVTRPLRVAGAAALAPLIDRVLKKIQKTLNLPSKLLAFLLVAASFASLCFSVVILLILSRWGK